MLGVSSKVGRYLPFLETLKERATGALEAVLKI